jgi:hypothetical protein
VSKYAGIIFLFLLAMLLPLRGQQSRPGNAATVRTRFPLISEESETYSTNGHDFFVFLPEHVGWRAASELTLALHPSAQLITDLAGAVVSVNGRTLPVSLDRNAPGKGSDSAIGLRGAVPAGVLRSGWNKVAVQLNLQPSKPQIDKERNWLVRRSECYLEANGERIPLFSELVRFPGSLAEEKLLHPDLVSSDAEKGPSATVAILLPLVRRDVHLRACAILGARFGQIAYLADQDCQLGSVQDWQRESTERNGVVVGTVDELGDLPMLKACCSQSLAELKAGQGMLAEVVVGKIPRQRRWILATAADDAGLEKAILALGSAPALSVLPPSPAIVESDPQQAAPAKAASKGEAGPESLDGKKITGLNQLGRLLLRDRWLRQAAFLLPENPSAEELQIVFDLSRRLGRQLQSSAVLWPEACSYSATAPPQTARVEGRSILLLGSVAQWRSGLPPNARLPIEMPARQTNVVLIQGRKNPISTFEPSLLLMQLLPSPWSSDQTLVAVGGWNGFANPALLRMLTDAPAHGRIYGNLSAMDALGRTAAYDSRLTSAESFSERINRQIPLGLGLAETARELKAEQARVRQTARVNNLILYLAGGVLLFFVVVRLYFLSDRERRRRKSVQEESSATSGP